MCACGKMINCIWRGRCLSMRAKLGAEAIPVINFPSPPRAGGPWVHASPAGCAAGRPSPLAPGARVLAAHLPAAPGALLLLLLLQAVCACVHACAISPLMPSSTMTWLTRLAFPCARARKDSAHYITRLQKSLAAGLPVLRAAPHATDPQLGRAHRLPRCDALCSCPALLQARPQAFLPHFSTRGTAAPPPALPPPLPTCCLLLLLLFCWRAPPRDGTEHGAHAHTRTHAPTRARTHTHTHKCARPLPCSPAPPSQPCGAPSPTAAAPPALLPTPGGRRSAPRRAARAPRPQGQWRTCRRRLRALWRWSCRCARVCVW